MILREDLCIISGEDDLEEVEYLVDPLKGQKIWANLKVEIHIKGEEVKYKIIKNCTKLQLNSLDLGKC